MNPEELRVDCRTYLNAAVCYTNSEPPCPELSVFASVGETDVSHSWAVVLEHMGHLKKKKKLLKKIKIKYIYIYIYKSRVIL